MPKTCCNNVVLNDRADIQQNSATGDNNQPVYTGTDFARGVPVNINTVGGYETFRGRQLRSDISHVVDARYRAGVLSSMRLLITTGLYKDRLFNIKVVKPVQKRGAPPMLELDCEEREN